MSFFVLEPTTSLAVLLIKCMEAEVVTVLPDFVVTSYCHTLLSARDHLILGEFYACKTLGGCVVFRIHGK